MSAAPSADPRGQSTSTATAAAAPGGGVLGLITLAAVALLLSWDFFPARFPSKAHDMLSALPLALIAVAWLGHRLTRRPTRGELGRAIVLAAAFLFWAANQFWPDFPRATLLNDLAVALFVIDVWLTMAAERQTARSAVAMKSRT
jgi:hypothetical protein